MSLNDAMTDADRQYKQEQSDLADLRQLVHAALEDNQDVIGFDRISDGEFGVEMRHGARCFITIELA